MKKINLINVGFLKESYLKEWDEEQVPAVEVGAGDSTVPEINKSNPNLKNIIQIIENLKNNFRKETAKISKDKWNLIAKDCDAVWQHLDNAAGRISTIIHRIK
jgi:hypothetical protein